MKKALILTLVVVFALSLAACGGGNSTPSGGNATATPPANSSAPATSSEKPAQSQTDNSQAGWRDMAAIAAGNNHTVGLKKDGTVLAVGANGDNQCDVSDWSDIIAIGAGIEHTVGLKKDGTVVAVGGGRAGSCDVSGWTDIVAIWAGGHATLGMKSDGTYIMTGDDKNYDFSDFTDIKEIAVGTGYVIGLKKDGTCVATEGAAPNGSGAEVKDWSGIEHIATGGTSATNKSTIGIKTDGTCIITGLRDRTEGISEWEDIVAVAFNSYQIAGLKKDGTLTGIEEHKQYNGDENLDLFQKWTDIVAISGGSTHMVGLKKDGTVFAVGENKYGECDVTGDTRDVSKSETTSQPVASKVPEMTTESSTKDASGTTKEQRPLLSSVNAGLFDGIYMGEEQYNHPVMAFNCKTVEATYYILFEKASDLNTTDYKSVYTPEEIKENPLSYNGIVEVDIGMRIELIDIYPQLDRTTDYVIFLIAENSAGFSQVWATSYNWQEAIDQKKELLKR